MDPSEVEEAGGGAGGGETNSTDEYHDDGLPGILYRLDSQDRFLSETKPKLGVARKGVCICP